MRSFRMSARRILTVAAAGVVGTIASLAFASPAAAHDVFVSGQASCDANGWKVSWTVTSFDPTGSSPTTWALKTVTQEQSGTGTLGALPAALTVTSPLTFISVDAAFEGSQAIPNTVSWVKLKIEAKWDNLNKDWGEKKVYKPTTCPTTTTTTTTTTAPPTTTTTTAPPTTTTTTAPPTTTSPPLAQTGASLGGTLGVGAALVAGGAALIGAFFYLRRRRSMEEPTA